MTAAEETYKKTVNRIAYAMLIFLLAFQLIGVVLQIISLLTESFSAVAADVAYEISYALLYALAFCVPALALHFLLAEKPQPIFAEFHTPRELPLTLFFGVAVVSAAAYLNSLMMSVFHYGEFTNEVLLDTDLSQNYQLVLMLLTTAVVPAFVEELLFRGVILGQLLPFGRTTAIVGSALLFGVMHQNAGQLFYATVAGLVIGWIYVRTRSIWVCILLHFFNNFQSVLQLAISERLPTETANHILYLLEGGIFLLGIISGVLLFLRERDNHHEVRAQGVFEIDTPPDAEFSVYPIPLRRRIRLFFGIPMIIFLAFCAVEMVGLILMAVIGF